MTREETIKVLAVLKAAYPAFYRGMKADELNGIVNLWASQFEGDDYKTVGAAVQAHIATDTKGYPPHIGAIKEAIRKITQRTKCPRWRPGAMWRRPCATADTTA